MCLSSYSTRTAVGFLIGPPCWGSTLKKSVIGLANCQSPSSKRPSISILPVARTAEMTVGVSGGGKFPSLSCAVPMVQIHTDTAKHLILFLFFILSFGYVSFRLKRRSPAPMIKITPRNNSNKRFIILFILVPRSTDNSNVGRSP